MEIIPLFSGSSGNSTLIRTESSNIIIDTGKNCKAIVNALAEVGTDPASIDAVMITHSHSDHVSGLDVFIRKYPTTVYATALTFAGIRRRFTKPHDDSPEVIVVPGQINEIAPGVYVKAVSTPHDAAGSCCYKIGADNRTCMVMTDVGHLTEELMNEARGVDAMLIESNYDQRMLVYGDYPEELKARIAGDGGHLSNDECAEAVKDLIDSGTRRFILGHLSENNNTPAKAEMTVRDYLTSFKLKSGTDYVLKVANRHEVTPPLCV